MNMKKLLPLVGVLAILVILVAIKKGATPEPKLVDQVKLSALVPGDTTSGDIARLELYTGESPDEKLTLAMEGDAWRLTSHFDAPVSDEKIDGFLKKLGNMKGEYRATTESDDDLVAYDLTDAKAFHVTGYTKDGTEPAFHILAGKSADYRTVFVRQAGESDVMVEQVNLRQEAGIYGESTDPPKPDSWFDKEIINVVGDAVTKIELETPHNKLAFEKTANEPEPAPETPTEGDSEGDAASTPPPAPEITYTWTLASGGYDDKLKESGVLNILTSLDPLNASALVDPAKKAEWGLDEPTFRCTLHLNTQDAPIVIEGSRVSPEDAYVRVASTEREVIYQLSKYDFERIFPNGTNFFTLPAIEVDAATVNRVEVSQPGGGYVLTKTDDTWSVATPLASLPVQDDKVSVVAETVATWEPADYADASVPSGLESALRRVTISTADGQSKSLIVGSETPAAVGSFARIDGSTKPFVISSDDAAKIFIEPKDLFQRSLFDLFDDDVQRIAVNRADDAYTLARTETGWTIERNGAATPAIGDAADGVALAIADFQASDILFGRSELGGGATESITFSVEDGTEHTLTFTGDQDGSRTFSASGNAMLFAANAEDVAALMPASNTLAQPVPEAPAEAKEEAAVEAAPITAPEGSAPEAMPATDTATEATPAE
jgi:hypothetical protein